MRTDDAHYVELLSDGYQLLQSDTGFVFNTGRSVKQPRRRHLWIGIFLFIVGCFCIKLIFFSPAVDQPDVLLKSLTAAIGNGAGPLIDTAAVAPEVAPAVAAAGVPSRDPPVAPPVAHTTEVTKASATTAAAVESLGPSSIISFVKEWEKFITEHNKSYPSPIEQAKRFDIFVRNLMFIVSHNSNESHSFKLAVNQFADLTAEEFRALHLSGYNAKNAMAYQNSIFEETTTATNHTNFDLLNVDPSILPGSVDWRDRGCVNTPKDQKKCGSCWSFSTAGAVEGAYCVKHKVLYDLSEQQLVDCGFPEGNQGCNGGIMDDGFQYIIDSGGLCLEEDYPYHAKVGRCLDTKCTPKVKVVGFEDVPNDSEVALRAAIALKGPVAVAIDASSMEFQFYHTGVFDVQCGTDLDHATLAVGYGTDVESKKDYWIVKNSWGPKWGDHGYIKMRRNGPELSGECGIQLAPSYPIVD